MKSRKHTRFVRGGTFFLCIVALLLLPLAALQAQEQSDRSDGPPPRPAEESLLILDTGGDEAGGESEEVQGGPLVSSWDFLRMVLILAAVVGLIYLIFWLLKRGVRRQLPQNDLIRLLGTRNLSGNRALHLVEMGKQVFLVGSAEGSISLISEIRDRETLDSIALERAQLENRTPQGFAQFFQSILKSGKQRESAVGGTVDFMKQQRQRLEKLQR